MSSRWEKNLFLREGVSDRRKDGEGLKVVGEKRDFSCLHVIGSVWDPSSNQVWRSAQLGSEIQLLEMVSQTWFY